MQPYVMLLLILSIPAIGIARRILIRKKFESMFPGCEFKTVTRYYLVDKSCIPYTPEGRRFINYCRDLCLLCLALMVASLSAIVVLGHWRGVLRNLGF